MKKIIFFISCILGFLGIYWVVGIIFMSLGNTNGYVNLVNNFNYFHFMLINIGLLIILYLYPTYKNCFNNKNTKSIILKQVGILLVTMTIIFIFGLVIINFNI